MSKISGKRNSYAEVLKKFAQNMRQHCYTIDVDQIDCKKNFKFQKYREVGFLEPLFCNRLWQFGRLAPDSLCTVPARSMQQQKNTPCTVPARSLHNEHLMHTPCTVSPCTLPARSMHGLCTVPAQ